MLGDPSSTRLEGGDETWREIGELVEEAANLSKLPMSEREFYVELLQRLMQATCAFACAAWSSNHGQDLKQTYQICADGGLLPRQTLLQNCRQKQHSQDGGKRVEPIDGHIANDVIACPDV